MRLRSLKNKCNRGVCFYKESFEGIKGEFVLPLINGQINQCLITDMTKASPEREAFLA